MCLLLSVLIRAIRGLIPHTSSRAGRSDMGRLRRHRRPRITRIYTDKKPKSDWRLRKGRYVPSLIRVNPCNPWFDSSHIIQSGSVGHGETPKAQETTDYTDLH